jgi:cytochrome c
MFPLLRSRRSPVVTAVAVAVVLCAAPLSTQAQVAPANGEKLFKQRCASCHAIAPGAKSAMGPNLAGVAGRKAATAPGYNYSPALKKWGKAWDANSLDAFLAGPNKFIPGTRMMIALPNPADRKAVVAYLTKPGS